MLHREPPSRFVRLLVFIVLVVVLLLLGLAGFWLWNEYNPFWDRTAEYREASNLAATIHKRPLTDAEFGGALQLCETGNVQARMGGVSIVEVRLNPERIPQAIEVLTRVSQARDPKLKTYAGGLLNRLTNPPALAPK
jgi:hypothetical protein